MGNVRAGQLAIVEIDEQKYYDDIRLQEYRRTNNFMYKMRYDELGDRKVKVLQERKNS